MCALLTVNCYEMKNRSRVSCGREDVQFSRLVSRESETHGVCYSHPYLQEYHERHYFKFDVELAYVEGWLCSLPNGVDRLTGKVHFLFIAK